MNPIYKYIVSGVCTAILVVGVIQLILHTFSNNQLPMEFQYNSHDYIYFPHKGVVHSPDCKHCQLIFD